MAPVSSETKTGAFCNCVHGDCGEFCGCGCHVIPESVRYEMDDRKRSAWNFILDRVLEKLPVYMDDVSILCLDSAGIQKFMIFIIDRGYEKEKDNPRFIYKSTEGAA